MSAAPPPARAPLPLHSAEVAETWLDYNDHMNVTWYTKVFDDAAEAFMRAIGMGETHAREHGGSWVILEAHTCYLAEARLGERLEVGGQLLGHDPKRIHLFLTMTRGGRLAATCEQVILHLDLATRRAAPFPAPVRARLAAIGAAHGPLPHPVQAGRAVTLERR